MKPEKEIELFCKDLRDGHLNGCSFKVLNHRHSTHTHIGRHGKHNPFLLPLASVGSPMHIIASLETDTATETPTCSNMK